MVQKIELTVALGDKKKNWQRECNLQVVKDEPCVVKMDDDEFEKKEFCGIDLFECLESLRLYLEERGYFLLCSGARIDVYPSGMSRDMSKGRLAYVTKIGMVASREDIVDIFAETDIENIGTVAQQKEYHEQWVNSIKNL